MRLELQVPVKLTGEMTVKELKKWARYYGVEGYAKMNKEQLVEAVAPKVREAEQEKQRQYERKQEAKLNAAKQPEEVEIKMVEKPSFQGSKSDRMRQLFDQGASVAQIARELDSNYSFVYGVIKRYKEEGAPKRLVGESKSAEARKLYDDGLSVSQIAKQLDINYAFAYGVIKRYREAKGGTQNGD